MMKNSQKGFATILLIVIAVVIIGGAAYYLTRTKTDATPTQTVSDIQTQDNEQIPDGFTYEYGEPYSQAKARLAENGWVAQIPADQTNSISEYPEISSCGSGIDAICSADFRKGSAYRHLNLQKGGRSGYKVWTVVGSE